MHNGRSDYWSPEDAKYLRRLGGPYQTSNVVTSIFRNITTLERLTMYNIEERKSIYDWSREFNKTFNSLLYTYEITCSVYSFDAKVELKDMDVQGESLKEKRYYSCFPLMKEITECLDKSYSFWKSLSYEERFPLLVERLDSKKAKSLLTWWNSIVVANYNMYPEEPNFECKEWIRRNEIVKEYIPEARTGNNPIAHLESYL
jgi:hypothetical protein